MSPGAYRGVIVTTSDGLDWQLDERYEEFYVRNGPSFFSQDGWYSVTSSDGWRTTWLSGRDIVRISATLAPPTRD